MLLFQSEDLLNMFTDFHQEEVVSVSYNVCSILLVYNPSSHCIVKRLKHVFLYIPSAIFPEFVAPKGTDGVYADAAQGLFRI